MISTPTRDEYDDDEELDDGQFGIMPATPAPLKARVNNLTNQVSELVRANQHHEKRHKAEVSRYKTQLDEAKSERDQAISEAKTKSKELERCRAEGDGKMHELNLHSEVLQQKAALVLAQEQMQIIELERRLVQAEAEKVLRDHRISMFKAKEEEPSAEIEEKDALLEKLNARLASANTSAGHQRAADDKSRVELESKVEKLEASLQRLVKSEKDARDQLAGILEIEKSNEGSADKEKKQLQASLEAVKADLAKKDEELGDLQEELSNFKESSKEREKALKQKLKEITLEKDRLTGLEDELEAMKTSYRNRSVSQSVQPEDTPMTASPPKPIKAKPKAKPIVLAPVIEITAPEDEEVTEKPKKVVKEPKAGSTSKASASSTPKARVRKTTPIPEPSEAGSDNDVPPTKKKARTPARSASPQPPVRKAKPLGETNENLPSDKEDANLGTPYKVMKPLVVKKKAKDRETLADEDAQPEKKKKRKLLGVQPAFQWDSIMNSGDGVIPSTLSPLKPTTAKTGSIPRVGFPSSASSRTLSRF